MKQTLPLFEPTDLLTQDDAVDLANKYLRLALPPKVVYSNGITPQSRHTSYLGAKDAESRAATQCERYLALLRAHPGGLTDLEAAMLLQLERSSINARRAGLVRAGLIVPVGFRKSPSGIRNVLWSLR